ncbi:cytosine permease [Streptomyces sp. NPDC056831]|uniref:cytosine permease n=1 Tax=Streptomyces sp. NPDC056831 TaxID=3345954 RepID=UPI0036869C12
MAPPSVLALVLGGSVTNSIVTLYSSSLNLQVLGVPWSRYKAIVISAAVTAAGSLCALFLTDFTSSLPSFLSLLIIVFAPWDGVFLTDMPMRRCHYDPPALHAGPDGAYWYRSGYHLAGVAALLVGMAFAALTCDSELWTGPLVAPLGGADLTLLGSLVSGLVYWMLARRTVAPHTDLSCTASTRRPHQARAATPCRNTHTIRSHLTWPSPLTPPTSSCATPVSIPSTRRFPRRRPWQLAHTVKAEQSRHRRR